MNQIGAGRFEDVYSYFTLAVGFLMKEHDIKALESFCANLGKKQTGQEAFQNAFGTSLEKFYSDFEAHYQNFLKSNSNQGFPR